MIEITEASIRDLMDLRRLEQACFDLDAWPLLDLAGVLSLPGIIRLRAWSMVPGPVLSLLK